MITKVLHNCYSGSSMTEKKLISEISDFPAIMNCTFEVESADVKKYT